LTEAIGRPAVLNDPAATNLFGLQLHGEEIEKAGMQIHGFILD
jgi:hypothetical protein